MAIRKKRSTKRNAAKVHTVKASLSVPRLSKAGSSLNLEIFARKEKIGEIQLGRGSLFWCGAKRHTRKRISWTKFAEMMDSLAYGK